VLVGLEPPVRAEAVLAAAAAVPMVELAAATAMVPLAVVLAAAAVRGARA
jgi:hypothetical protein